LVVGGCVWLWSNVPILKEPVKKLIATLTLLLILLVLLYKCTNVVIIKLNHKDAVRDSIKILLASAMIGF
jgi:hypothetical protein